MARLLPPIATQLTQQYGGWVVGGAAAPGATRESIRDIDILIPMSRWHEAAMIIPRFAKLNTFRGLSFLDDGVPLDVWPGELTHIMENYMCKWVWQPRVGCRWKKEAPDAS